MLYGNDDEGLCAHSAPHIVFPAALRPPMHGRHPTSNKNTVVWVHTVVLHLKKGLLS